MSARPHSHTQWLKDGDGTERPCPPDDHHWVDAEDGSVCSRCGDFVPYDPEPEG